MSKVRNDDPPKVDHAAIEAQQRAKAAELDSYLDEVVTGAGESPDDDEPVAVEETTPDTVAATTPATPRKLTQDSKRPAVQTQEEEERDYSGEFYPTVVKGRRDDQSR